MGATFPYLESARKAACGTSEPRRQSWPANSSGAYGRFLTYTDEYSIWSATRYAQHEILAMVEERYFCRCRHVRWFGLNIAGPKTHNITASLQNFQSVVLVSQWFTCRSV